MTFNPENYYLKRVGDCEFKAQYRNVVLKEITTFGRSPDSNVVLKNKRCSLNHCKILFENGRIFLEDVGSSAGTIVDNQMIKGARIEVYENVIIGMGADPRRADHINQQRTYIYQVKKVEPALEILDSDEEEMNNGALSGIPISSPRPNRLDRNGTDGSDEDIEIQEIMNNNQDEDEIMTQVIEEHIEIGPKQEHVEVFESKNVDIRSTSKENYSKLDEESSSVSDLLENLKRNLLNNLAKSGSLKKPSLCPNISLPCVSNSKDSTAKPEFSRGISAPDPTPSTSSFIPASCSVQNTSIPSPSSSEESLKRKSEDLLDEIEMPREQERIIYRKGIALVVKPKEKRGRRKKKISESEESSKSDQPMQVETKIEKDVGDDKENGESNVQKAKERKVSTDSKNSGKKCTSKSRKSRTKSVSVDSTPTCSSSATAITNNEAFYSKTLENNDVNGKTNGYVYEPDTLVGNDKPIEKSTVNPEAQKRLSNFQTSSPKKMYQFPTSNSPSPTDFNSDVPANMEGPGLSTSAFGNLRERFPNLCKGVGTSEPSSSKKPPPARKKSIFVENDEITKDCATLDERTNKIRHWKQPTTKLIDDIPMEDPQKKRRGRPPGCSNAGNRKK